MNTTENGLIDAESTAKTIAAREGLTLHNTQLIIGAEATFCFEGPTEDDEVACEDATALLQALCEEAGHKVTQGTHTGCNGITVKGLGA